ncbi:DUF2975 domain-containing protein [Chitinophaga filiformis]|uniref:DUF2975 domain-containing protein n=1 Tax=Chitinophaga filiformis TaxID=104663 RepID=UPI001F2377F3|nr:DUF2975 domain-containing protein [Chitinophaga filiformis]MCF6406364.1 DUF2975 domain-containing protein [Chitinophaga filiformis]
MKTKPEKVLRTLNMVAWVGFVVLAIRAGALLTSYGVSIFNPAATKNLYMGLDLSPLREHSFWHYTSMILLKIAFYVLEAYVAYLLISVLSKIRMKNPFTMEVANNLVRMSNVITAAWIVAVIHNWYVGWLSFDIAGLKLNVIPLEFIFVSGVLFVIAQIFKKGVELQTENELTV